MAPGCTKEGVGYILKCWRCRRDSKKVQYKKETLRSPYQRGREHKKEVIEAKKFHPLVMYFGEVHGGERQTILMRTVRETNTALER